MADEDKRHYTTDSIHTSSWIGHETHESQYSSAIGGPPCVMIQISPTDNHLTRLKSISTGTLGSGEMPGPLNLAWRRHWGNHMTKWQISICHREKGILSNFVSAKSITLHDTKGPENHRVFQDLLPSLCLFSSYTFFLSLFHFAISLLLLSPSLFLPSSSSFSPPKISGKLHFSTYFFVLLLSMLSLSSIMSRNSGLRNELRYEIKWTDINIYAIN